MYGAMGARTRAVFMMAYSRVKYEAFLSFSMSASSDQDLSLTRQTYHLERSSMM